MNKNAEFVTSIQTNKCDPELGKRVHKHLFELGIEHPYDMDVKPDYGNAHFELEHGIKALYHSMGLDVDMDPSIRDTPRRVADMFVGELFRGLNYDFFPKCTATPSGRGTEHMVLVGQIETISLCEHHLQTIYGYTHIAYIPKTTVLGLSKFARVTDFFARRPQIQERMTEQTYHALELVLGTSDIAVVQRCQHFCMKARGVGQPNSWTETSKMGGKFMSNPALRQEFTHAIGR